MSKSDITLPIVNSCIIIILSGLLFYNVWIKDDVKVVNIVINDVEMADSTVLSFQDSVYNYMVHLNIAHPEVAMRQAVLESGYFTSSVFKENNNMFGMRPAINRPNVSIGENRGYAVYKDWKQSIVDYALWQVWSAKRLSEDEYYGLLQRIYAEDSSYVETLKNIKL